MPGVDQVDALGAATVVERKEVAAGECEELRDAARLQAACQEQAPVRLLFFLDLGGGLLGLVPCRHFQQHYSIVKAVIGAVMAGGSGSRVGGAKALLELRGTPLISYPLRAFAEAGIEAVVVAKRDSSLPPLDAPIWQESDEPTHPLLGIVTALERAESRSLVVCGCDMPFVTAEFLSYLSGRDDPLVVPYASGRLQPLIARYDLSLRGRLRQELQGPRALHHIIAELQPAIVDHDELRRFGDPARLLFNVNTPEDLARAEQIARG